MTREKLTFITSHSIINQLPLEDLNTLELETIFYFMINKREFKFHEKKLIYRALDLAKEAHKDQKRDNQEPYIHHPIIVALIVNELYLDKESIIAALLHDTLEDTHLRAQDIKDIFKETIYHLVEGLTKLVIPDVKYKNEIEKKSIRKMLIATISDIRVILIKLADRLHNMSTIQHLNRERQIKNARECMSIFIPIAHNLGISQIKIFLEDLSLKYLDPSTYQVIKEYIASSKQDRANNLKKINTSIYKAAQIENISIQVTSRAKHFYSIYAKLKKKQKSLSEIYDVQGIRIFCKTEADCYIILGMVHKIYKPIEGRFKDYIAVPKSNQYQSLHSTVMIEDKLTEIQIRTFDMHQVAEYGIAAHWLYKKNNRDLSELNFINRLKSWKKLLDTQEKDKILEEVQKEIFSQSIYVFTPQKKIIELPVKSTPIDFAYHIHSDIGDHCYGAKVDGKIVALSYHLKNSQTVEIISANKAHPHVDWLQVIQSSRARTRIKHWLNAHNTLNPVKKVPIPTKESLKTPDLKQKEEAKKNKESSLPKESTSTTLPVLLLSDQEQSAHIKITFAQCCHATKEDNIVGFITQGKGVSIHKQSCPNIRALNSSERLIEVIWEEKSLKMINIHCLADEKRFILKNLTELIQDKYFFSITELSVKNEFLSKRSHIFLKIKLPLSYPNLRSFIKDIYKLDGLLEVHKN